MAVRVTSAFTTAEVTQVTLRASVSTQSFSSNAVVQTPAAEIAYIDLVVRPDYASPVASIAYASPVIATELDYSGRYRLELDSVVTLDGAVLGLSKGLADAVSAAQESFTLQADKALFETYSAIDQLAAGVVKALQHTYSIEDVSFRLLIKQLRETLSTADSNQKQIVKLLQSGFALNDSLDAGDGLLYQVTKSILNVVLASDQNVIGISKQLQETQSVVDLVLSSVSKAVADAASLSDGSVTSFDKASQDVVLVSEAIVLALTRTFQDSYSLQDQHALSLSRPSSDSQAVVDSVSVGPGKGLSDQALAGDTFFSFGLGVGLFEQIYQSELRYHTVDKATSDAISVPDALARVTQKPASDSVTAPDSIDLSMAYVRVLESGFATNDSTGVGDGLAFQATKSFNNVSFANDSHVKGTALKKLESLSITDTGSLVSQGYCDITYFAEDYVGDSRSF